MDKNFKVLLFYPNEPLLGIAPSNLAIISACLKENGFKVKLFDCTIYKPKNKETNDDIREKLGHVKKSNFEDYFDPADADVHQEFIKIVNEFHPNLIAMTLLDGTISFSLSFLKQIKDKKIPIVTGGVGSTFLYEKILNSNLVDFVCIGEGEEAVVELCNKLYNNEDCSNIKNIYLKDKVGNIIKNPLRRLIDINALPMPDFSIFAYNRFYRPFLGNVVRMMQTDIDRGCPFGCTYCGAPALKKKFKDNGCGNYYRVKDWDKVFSEITYLVKKHDINCLWISSETFLALPLHKFKQFAERYIKEVNLPFWCQSRFDTFTEEKTKLLVEMGCKAVSVGLEHGSEKIRKAILNKHISDKKIIEAAHVLSKYNLFITINNMIGLPDETREDVFDSIKLNKQISSILHKNHTLNIFTFIPFSGTELRELCIQKGYITGKEEIPMLFFNESLLTMPSMSKKEIHGLEKTMALYIMLPEYFYSQIKIAENDDEKGELMFNQLIEIKNELGK